MSSFFSYLIMLFVVAPLQASVTDGLKKMGATSELVQAGRNCITTVVPKLAAKAQSDYRWATGTAIRVAIGMQSPQSLLAGSGPDCDRVSAMLGKGSGKSEGSRSGEAGEA